MRSEDIDAPIRDVVTSLAGLPYCFTLQSCYGHFVHRRAGDRRNLERLPDGHFTGQVEYRIAYLAMCIERGKEGLRLRDDLRELTTIDRSLVQFGCAEWFWRRQVNTFVVQVEPERYRDRDAVNVGIREARRIEEVRDAFFARITELIDGRVHP